MSLKLTRKLIITGPESTGKTTLAKALANKLKVAWLPEYARKHLENLNRPYKFEDVIEMAQIQLKKENEVFKRSSGSLILDTNLLVYKIWIHEKYNHQVDWIEKEIEKSKRCPIPSLFTSAFPLVRTPNLYFVESVSRTAITFSKKVTLCLWFKTNR